MFGDGQNRWIEAFGIAEIAPGQFERRRFRFDFSDKVAEKQLKNRKGAILAAEVTE